MSRSILRAVQSLILFLTAASLSVFAAERSAKESPAETKARQYVQAALRAEAAGDNDQRAEQLSSAALAAPELAAANWHLQRVRGGGKWLALADAEKRAADDPQRAEYRKLRDEAEGNPKLTRNLARWCVKAGWDETARLHYAQLLSRDDADEEMRKEAIKRLDLHNVGGTWLTGEELKAREERVRAIDGALRKWRPRLKKLQLVIDGEDYVARDKAIKELQAIDDPQAIIALESFLIDGGDRFSEEAVKLLAKFPQYESTEALVRFAILSQFLGARNAAITVLKRRPKHDYMPLFLSGLIEPIKSQFSIAVGRNGTVQYNHAIQQENAGQRVVNVSSQTAMPGVFRVNTGKYEPLRRIGPGNIAYVLAQVDDAKQAALEIETQREVANLQVSEANRRVFQALESITQLHTPQQPSAWWNWWQQYNEYDWPKPTYCVYQPTASFYYAGTVKTSCFLAGTLVRMQTGQAPIESIKPGDRVLAQDQDSGELAYKSVLTTTLRPPSKMIRIKAGGEEIVTTLGHPFWVSGQGWKMAKQLKEGDLLHSLGGAVRVERIEPLANEREAYNLVVDDLNTYFVGQQGLLVHDNEFRKPTRAIVPGLVADESASK